MSDALYSFCWYELFTGTTSCDLYERSLDLLALFLVKTSIIITCLGLHLRDYTLLFL